MTCPRPDPLLQLERAQQAVLDAITDVQGRGKGGMSTEQQARGGRPCCIAVAPLHMRFAVALPAHALHSSLPPQAQFDAAVAVLEADGGVAAPTASPLLNGAWRLLFTTRPGTASPIQRTFTAVDKFKIYQTIELADQGEEARVCQVVDFGRDVGYLRVEAQAATDSRPLPGFTPRRGQGLPFGIMGTSSTVPPARPDLRVNFQFDQCAGIGWGGRGVAMGHWHASARKRCISAALCCAAAHRQPAHLPAIQFPLAHLQGGLHVPRAAVPHSLSRTFPTAGR